MAVVRLIAGIANWVLLLYILVLLARMVLEYIPLFNRQWRPTGAGLIFAEVVYTVTDPPIRFVRRFVRPLRVGMISLDLSFTIVLLACFVLSAIVRTISWL